MLDIKLKRTEDLFDYIKSQYILTIDDPNYKYYFFGGWVSFPKCDELDWDSGYLGLYSNDKRIGFIGYTLCRTHNFIESLSIFLAPEYRCKRFGKYALQATLDYLLDSRGFRKVSFKIIRRNIAIKYVIAHFSAIKRIGSMEGHFKLRDGKYYDVILFEVMQKAWKTLF